MRLSNLSVNIASHILEPSASGWTPDKLVADVKNMLDQAENLLGSFVECTIQKSKDVLNVFSTKTFQLEYSQKSLTISFYQHRPSGVWRVEDFRFN